MGKHTPGPYIVAGPWHGKIEEGEDIHIYKGPILREDVILEDGRKAVKSAPQIAKVLPVYRGSDPDHPGFKKRIDGEHLANARLFAAAPDLLAAAELAMAWATDHGPVGKDWGVFEPLEAAISKAYGKDVE